VFLATGFKTTARGTDPDAPYSHFMMTHYHIAADDGILSFHTASVGQVATVSYLVDRESPMPTSDRGGKRTIFLAGSSVMQ
jgi:hypothetical protein